MKYFDPLRRSVQKRKNINLDIIEEAYVFAYNAHKGQKRRSGEDYIIHPVAVAQTVCEIEGDEESIIAALLHDTVEDTKITNKDIAKNFGNSAAHLVESVTKVSQMEFLGTAMDAKTETLKKMFNKSTLDERGIIVKLADVNHNTKTIEYLPQKKRESYAKETMDIFYPLAKVFGIWKFKRNFENNCFPILYKQENEIIEKITTDYKNNSLNKIQIIEKDIDKILSKEIDKYTLEIRYFSPFSHYKHCKDKEIFFEEIKQFYGFSILVTTIHECYEVLGLLHKQFAYKENTFTDYISIPKHNAYQGIHTTIFHNSGEQVNFRIQTYAMRNINEYGQYYLLPKSFSKSTINTSLESLQKNYYDNYQYLEDLKKDILQNKIFIFTPKGESIFLPKGASGIDFAYAAAPLKAHCLMSINIDEKNFPVTTILKNGQVVEMVVNSKPFPKPYWLNHVKTSVAKQCIIQWASQLPEKDLLQRGKISIESELQKLKMSYNKVFVKNLKQHLLHIYPEKTFEDIIIHLGKGTISTKEIMQNILVFQKSEKEKRILNKILSSISKFFYFFYTSNIINKKADIIQLNITAKDRPQMLYDILRVISIKNINISSLRIYSLRPSYDAYYEILLEVSDLSVFSEIFDQLNGIEGVKKVKRD